MITDRVRAPRAGSSITVAFLAREMGREAGRELSGVERRGYCSCRYARIASR